MQGFLSDPLPFRASSCPQPVNFPQKHISWRSGHPKKKKKKSLITLIKWILINVFVLNYYFPPFSSRPRTSSVLWGRKDLRWGSCRKPLRPLSRTCDGWRRTWTRSSAGCSARRRHDSSSLVPLTPSGDVTGHMQMWVILPWQQPEP